MPQKLDPAGDGIKRECQPYLFNVLLQISQTLKSMLMCDCLAVSSPFCLGRKTIFTKQLHVCSLFVVKFPIINT